MVEIGDQGFVAPIPGGRWAFVPVSEAEVGDEGVLVPIAGGRWLAVPQYALAVGDPALVMPEAGGIGTAAIHWRAVAATTPIPTEWTTIDPGVSVFGQPIACDRISDTSIIVATASGGGYPHIIRSNDSGATWADVGPLLIDGPGTSYIDRVLDVCGLHDMDGGHLVVGAVENWPGFTYGVWKYNPENGRYTPTESSALVVDNSFQFVRVASGYFIHTDGFNQATINKGFFSADGTGWAVGGIYTGHLIGRGLATCPAGDIILYGTRFVGGSGGVNRSIDAGASWSISQDGYFGAGAAFGVWGNGVCATIVRDAVDLAYIHLISDDAGASWTASNSSTTLMYGDGPHWVSCGAGYVARMGGGAYESLDYGVTWAAISTQPATHTHECEGVVLPSGIFVFPMWNHNTGAFLVFRGTS